eukprot:6871559-Pyramimonas_sp.AAC.1
MAQPGARGASAQARTHPHYGRRSNPVCYPPLFGTKQRRTRTPVGTCTRPTEMDHADAATFVGSARQTEHLWN